MQTDRNARIRDAAIRGVYAGIKIGVVAAAVFLLIYLAFAYIGAIAGSCVIIAVVFLSLTVLAYVVNECDKIDLEKRTSKNR